MSRGRKPHAPVCEPHRRASAPGLYRCPYCGETLSGPAQFYDCPANDKREAKAA